MNSAAERPSDSGLKCCLAVTEERFAREGTVRADVTAAELDTRLAVLDATRYQATPSRYYTPRFVYGGCYREGVVDPTSSINTLPSHIIGAM